MWKNSRISKVRPGDMFGMLTVATLPEYCDRDGKRYAMCWCDCSCGIRVEVMAANLIRKNTKSCGCQHRVVTAERNRTHSFSGTRIYMIWAGMVKRCEDTNDKRFKDYGGRGIKVCDEWRHDFEAFFDWAMANGYNHDLTIERKETNLGYSPENCRWATWAEQAGNKRNNHAFAAFGETKHLAAWARDPRCVVGAPILCWRINQGMDPEEAITRPSRNRKRSA